GFARSLTSLLDGSAPAPADDDAAAGEADAATAGAGAKPAVLAAVFDSRTPTFRHKMYSEYKATRQKTPDDLHEQVPLVEEFLAALGIPVLRADGFEADDIIATLAKKCREEKRRCYIISSDKDLLQLVGGGVFELRPAKNTKTEGQTAGQAASLWDVIGAKEVKAEWGVEPDKILDLLSLAGDTSDNIPGIKGIGDKTAGKLLARYGSLEEIYKNIAAIAGSIGKKLAEGKESAYFSRDLVRLDENVPLRVKKIDELSLEKLDRAAGARVLLREGMIQSARQLSPNTAAPAGAGATGGAAGGAANEELPEQSGFGQADNALLGNGHYKTVLDIDELKTILEKAQKQGFLTLDFETNSLDVWNGGQDDRRASVIVGISLAVKPKEAFYVPVAPHDGAEYNDPQTVRNLFAGIFSDPQMTIIAHNAKFDYKASRGWGVERWKCKIWDTMVAAWLADPERSNYSLDSLASYTFGVTPIAYFDIVPKGSTFDTVPLETATRYSCEDADYCARLKEHLKPILEKNETLELLEKLEMPLLPILGEMEGEGIKIEPKALEVYGRELAQELDKIQADTWKTVGREFNLSSTKQLQEVLFVERKLKPGKKTKTGYSTDVAVLEELALEDPVPALILRHRTLSKLKSTYVDALAEMADSEGRLHTNFVQTGTATGRLSSREPNLQNIPIRAEEGRRIREAFIASPDCLLISADYSQIELVILAHLSQDENLIGAFMDGKDVHARTAALIFGIDENEVKSEQRRIAKTINFGVMYGMSAFRLAGELGISRGDASSFIKAYFDTYSGVRDFIEGLIQKTERTGYVSTILGRRRYIPTINSRNKTEKAAAERVAVNTPIQGSAADIVKTAMLNLSRRLDAEKSPARLLLQVHDELILECPEKAADQAAIIVKTEMEKAAKLRIPLRVSVESGKSWGGFH
ncbi:MAG: DNA polymerase I, partial [Spirochaetes bacterium]|nr:DNA polymerase I [Spirochaetota bacterium]